jgi:predicted dehydrogenase
LIGRGDLDAIQIAVPDQWHAIPAIAAARAGLDIHGQKPLARSIREGRAICNAVHRYGRVWQTGSQQRSDWKFRRACELVRNGRIGKILKVEVGLPTGGATDVKPVMQVPEGLDWDFWLGPAPYVPYRGVVHWNWRWIMDYSGGQLTDWAGHHIDIAHWGMGWDYTGPVEIAGKGNYPKEGLYNVPTEYKFSCKYADGTIMTVANNQQLTQGAKWYGQNGWIHVNRGGLTASNEKILRAEIAPNEIKLYESRDHKQNFLDCVKSRKLTICPAEVGHRSISVGLLGEIAMLTGRKIKWNPDTEEIIGDAEASALLGRSYREPWIL